LGKIGERPSPNQYIHVETNFSGKIGAEFNLDILRRNSVGRFGKAVNARNPALTRPKSDLPSGSSMLELLTVFGIMGFMVGVCTASRDLDSRFSLMVVLSEEVVAALFSVAEAVQCQRARIGGNYMSVSLTSHQ
jgi:hypothetical protein